MNYNLIINIGKKNVVGQLSTTLLFPFINDDIAWFYFFDKDFDLSRDKKLEHFYSDVLCLFQKNTAQHFNIIYYNSDYEELLENTRELNLPIIAKHIRDFSSKFDDCSTKQHKKFNHLLIFLEPWCTESDYDDQLNLIKDSGLFQFKDNDKHNQWFGNEKNSFFIHSIGLEKKVPLSIGYNIISFEGIKIIHDFLSECKKNRLTLLCEFLKNIHFNKLEITSFNETEFRKISNNYLNFLGSIKESIRNINEKVRIDVIHEDRDINIWELILDTYPEIDKIVDTKNLKNYTEFKSNYNLFEGKLENELNKTFRTIKDLRIKEKELQDGWLKGIEHTRETIEKEVKEKRAKIRTSLSSSESNVDLGLIDCEKTCNNSLKESLQKLEFLFKELPNKYSTRWFVTITTISILVPLGFIFIFGTLNIIDIQFLLSISLILLSIVLSFFYFRKKWERERYKTEFECNETIRITILNIINSLTNHYSNKKNRINQRTILKKNLIRLINHQRKLEKKAQKHLNLLNLIQIQLNENNELLTNGGEQENLISKQDYEINELHFFDNDKISHFIQVKKL